MQLLEYFEKQDSETVQLILTGILILSYLLSAKISSRLIRKFAGRKKLALPRVIYTVKFVRFLFFLISLLLIGLIWDIYFTGLSKYFFTFFTVAGVALFATWSILSNITSAVILFFYFPYRLGEKIRIVDGDNSIEGEIFDLNLFSIIIENEQGQKVTYPNNLALQKAIVLLKDQ